MPWSVELSFGMRFLCRGGRSKQGPCGGSKLGQPLLAGALSLVLVFLLDSIPESRANGTGRSSP